MVASGVKGGGRGLTGCVPEAVKQLVDLMTLGMLAGLRRRAPVDATLLQVQHSTLNKPRLRRLTFRAERACARRGCGERLEGQRRPAAGRARLRGVTSVIAIDTRQSAPVANLSY